LEKGYDSIDNISLAQLTDTIYDCIFLYKRAHINFLDIEDIALTIKSDTEHSGRTEANLIDALHGLLQYDVKAQDIEEFMNKKKEKSLPFTERIFIDFFSNLFSH